MPGVRINNYLVVRGLRSALLSLEDTVLVASLALFTAVEVERCRLSMYHLKLLNWLFATLCIIIVVIVSARAHTVAQVLTFSSSERPARWGAWPGARAATAVLARTVVHGALFVMTLFQLGVLASMRMPDFPQPAMALPAFCFSYDIYPRAFRGDMDKYPAPRLVGQVALFSSAILGFLNGMHDIYISRIRHWRRRRRRPSGSGDGNSGSDSNGGTDNDNTLHDSVLQRAMDTLKTVILSICIIVCIVFMFREWNAAQKFLDPITAEKAWGFGQIIAVVMLALPILSFLRVVLGAFYSFFMLEQ
jgi:hypothetical protein